MSSKSCQNVNKCCVYCKGNTLFKIICSRTGKIPNMWGGR